jgi:phage terminase large subunit
VLAKPYVYEVHIMPHDINNREWGSNADRRIDTVKGLGIRPVKVLPQASVDDGINAGRALIKRANFDQKKCERGLDALRGYHKEWDEKLKMFSAKPKHDWTSHGADAWRYLAQGLRSVPSRYANRPAYAVT